MANTIGKAGNVIYFWRVFWAGAGVWSSFASIVLCDMRRLTHFPLVASMELRCPDELKELLHRMAYSVRGK